MGRAEDYERQAAEADRKARQALSELERETYRKIAKGWRDLRREVERSEKRGL
jgi:hypothetical protein